MKWLQTMKQTAEYLCGQTDRPPWDWPPGCEWLGLALSWAGFILVIWVFCGQKSKFIYIDF